MKNAVLLVLALLVAFLVAASLRGRSDLDRAAGADPAGRSEAQREAAGLRGAVAPAAPGATAPGVAPTLPSKPSDVWQGKSIRGRLLYPDGSPAASIYIYLLSIATRTSRMSGSRSTSIMGETAADGSFTLTGLEDATYSAFAQHETGARSFRLGREVEPQTDPVVWTLEEGRRRLTVHVLDPEGTPALSASVHLVTPDRAAYAYAAKGVARFFDFADAPLTEPAGVVAQPFFGEEPALWTSTGVAGVDLAGGEVTVRCERGGVLEGRVPADAKGHVAGGEVHATAVGGGLRSHFAGRSVPIEPDGRFRFEAMAQGPWSLTASYPYFVTLTETRVVEVGASDVVLPLLPTRSAKVRVVDPAGRPVVGATVSTQLQFKADAHSVVTGEDGTAFLEDLRTGDGRTLWAATQDPPMGAHRDPWVVEDTILELKPSRIGDSVLSGVVHDAKGAPLSFVAVWARQEAGVRKGSADEAGRFRLEEVFRGPTTLEVRLAEGWDQPESSAPAATLAVTAPAADVSFAVELGDTLGVGFPNWPYDVDREGAVLVDEASGGLVRPMSWTWSGIRFARLDPKASYTLFVHAEATDLFALAKGLRAGKDHVMRLERGLAVAGRVEGVASGEETKVVATLFGVAMGADIGREGRFEIRGMPADATVDLVATATSKEGTVREAKGHAKAGETSVVLAFPPPR